jgi:hypothetical protein
VKGNQGIIQNFKKKLRLKKDENEISKKKNKLFNSSTDTDTENGDFGSKDEKLIDNDKDKRVAWDQYHKIDGARATAMEMETISIDVMKDLHHQSEQLNSINGNVNLMNNELSTSKYFLKKMISRENRNKVILALFTIILLVIFCVIIFQRLFGEKSVNN